MITAYLKEVSDCLANVKQESLDSAISILARCIEQEGQIFIAGNGGSAAHSSHFAVDLLKVGSSFLKPIRAVSLVDNVPVLTATSNDIGFESIFSWQLLQHATHKDTLIVISSSGNSLNVVNAVGVAKQIGMNSVSISGFDGGVISQIATINIVTNSSIGNYGPVEDAHGMICHYITRKLKENFF